MALTDEEKFSHQATLVFVQKYIVFSLILTLVVKGHIFENGKQTPNKKECQKINGKKTPRNSKKLFPCDKCSKKFAKKSNLDNHKEVKHKGLVWICPFCQKTQVSKYSHERHLKTCPHRNQREQAEQINADANSVYLSSKIEYTPKAASTLIDQLTKNNVYRANVIIDLKKVLIVIEADHCIETNIETQSSRRR